MSDNYRFVLQSPVQYCEFYLEKSTLDKAMAGNDSMRALVKEELFSVVLISMLQPSRPQVLPPEDEL